MRLQIIILYVAGRHVLRMRKIVLLSTMRVLFDVPGDVIATRLTTCLRSSHQRRRMRDSPACKIAIN